MAYARLHEPARLCPGAWNTHSLRRGNAVSNIETWGVSGMVRLPSTLSLMVMLFHWKSTSFQLSAASSSRRAPVSNNACKYAECTGFASLRTCLNHSGSCSGSQGQALRLTFPHWLSARFAARLTHDKAPQQTQCVKAWPSMASVWNHTGAA